MPKRILVAEKSDAIRGITESLLHQNGYDVISAATLEKAKELIISSQPNMLIIGADLRDNDGKYLYDSVEDNPSTAAIPLLLIADPDGRSLPFPDEVIISRPYDPKEFMEKVRLFAGAGAERSNAEKVSVSEPFALGTVDDELLDAALGIDNIDVEESEEMDKRFMTGRLRVGGGAEKTNGFGIHQPGYEEGARKDDSQKVESLMIREEENKTAAPPKNATPQQDLSSSSKIEIASDQYGLIEPDSLDNLENRHAPHDYDWFIKEMRKDTSGISFKAGGEKLPVTPTNEILNPLIAPAPEEKEAPRINPGGVDEFIAEFKKEVSKIDAVPEMPAPEQALPAASDSPAVNIPPEEIRHCANYLAELLAEKLAKKIVDKLDAEEIYRLVKDDLAAIIPQKK